MGTVPTRATSKVKAANLAAFAICAVAEERSACALRVRNRTGLVMRASSLGAHTACMSKQTVVDKKQFIRQHDHLTRPPRLEGKVKNAMMNPVRKPKKKRIR